MALRGKIVDLVRLHFLNDSNQIGGISQIPVVQRETDIFLMRILVKMINAIGIEGRCAALYTMNVVALRQKEVGQVRAILSGDTRN